LRVFKNTVLRKIFGPNRDDIIEEWRRLHKEELHDLYSPNTIRVEDEMGRACSTYGGDERCMQGCSREK
jgi:hypothetical protein